MRASTQGAKDATNLRSRLFLLLLFSLLCSSCFQKRLLAKTFSEIEGGYIADHWNVDDGIPGTQVLSISQSTDGYIWLGTYYGLARFDGQRFTVFDANTPGFPSGTVHSIQPGSRGSLFLIVGAQLVHYSKGVFNTSDIRLDKPSHWINQHSITADGKTILSEMNQEPQQRQLISIRNQHRTVHAVRTNNSQPKNLIFNVATDQDEITWWANRNELGILTSDGVSVLHEFGDDERISAGPTPAKLGGVWFVVSGQLMRYDDERLFSNEIPPSEGAQQAIIRIIEAMDGSLWIRRPGNHYQQYARQDDNNYILEKQFKTPNGIPFIDAEGTFWLASGINNRGLTRIRHRHFNRLRLAAPARNEIHTMIQKGDNLLLGTSKGLFDVPLDRIHDAASIQPIKLGKGRTWALTANREGLVFGGKFLNSRRPGSQPHQDPPTFLVDGKSSRSIDSFAPGSRITALCHDLENRLWIGSTDDGLARLDGDKFEDFKNAKNRPNTPVLSLACARDGTMWIGMGNSGIYRYKNNRFEHISKQEGLPPIRVRAISEGKSGDIWFATGGHGIYRFRNEAFQQYSDEHGLPSNEINTLIDDHLGNLWFGSYNGVHRVSFDNFDRVAKGETKHLFANSYTMADGLTSLQCNSGHPASYRTHDGRLWFTSVKGVSYVDPKSLPVNRTPPRVLLDTLYLDGRPNVISQHKKDQTFNIPAHIERIEIQFTGLNFRAPEELRFRYRMTGIAKEWTETGNQRSVVFQDLVQGDYRFEVTAANDSGVWNEKGAEVILKVEGPIWESTWFRTLVGLGLIGLISLAFLMRIARDKRRKREQDRFTRDMLLQQEADRKRIARELHDSLEQNLLVIKNRATLTLNSPEKQEKMGTALKEISHISLDSIQEVRSIANNLRPYQIDRLGLDKAIQGMLNQIADASAISIEHEIEPIPKDLSSELQINLYRIIQEGMNNSLKHAEATQMIVTLLVSDRAVTLRIKDNGCGFDADAEKTRESHGFGLSGIRERSTMFNGTSELITAPGNGTEWIIRFPIG
ncbi:histidine kinase [Verrucomicrobia bacterium]|jgi:signal transduction histidine kinase/ligand-binding sensor domain-containing protein|nr:histidine kinase [Verrucomicrobiota bacterium]